MEIIKAIKEGSAVLQYDDENETVRLKEEPTMVRVFLCSMCVCVCMCGCVVCVCLCVCMYVCVHVPAPTKRPMLSLHTLFPLHSG